MFIEPGLLYLHNERSLRLRSLCFWGRPYSYRHCAPNGAQVTLDCARTARTDAGAPMNSAESSPAVAASHS